MAISVYSCGYLGIESYIVEIETDISNGLPVFNIVGMGDLAILESKERIRSCFKNIGLDFPVKRVLVNLSPADIKKKGSSFDLGIFLGILSNIGKIRNIENFKNYLILGEISLNGEVKSVKGAITETSSFSSNFSLIKFSAKCLVSAAVLFIFQFPAIKILSIVSPIYLQDMQFRGVLCLREIQGWHPRP